MTHQLIENFERQVAAEIRTVDTNSLIKELTERFLAKHGDELFPDKYFMTDPVTAFDKNVVVVVEAKTRALSTKWTLEMAGDFPPETREVVKEEIKNVLLTELYSELSTEVAELKKQGLIMCPYVLLVAGLTIDPNTFQPEIRFKTRYGTCPKPA